MKKNQNFIELVETRLHYMLGECSPEEYDPELVKTLIDMKKIINPYPVEKLPVHISYNDSTKQQRRIINISYTSPVKKNVAAVLSIAATACIISIILIGINAPINAGPDTGFFFRLNKDNEGMTMITDPNSNDTNCIDCQCCEKCPCGCTSTTTRNE